MNVTRWDTLFLMFDSVICQFYSINKAIQAYKFSNLGIRTIQELPIFDAQTMTDIINIQELLEMLRTISTESQKRSKSIAYLIPSCTAVQKILSKNFEEEYIREFCALISKGFQKRIKKHYYNDEKTDYKEEYIVAAFLAPYSHQSIKRLEKYETYKDCFRSYMSTRLSVNTPNPSHLPRRASGGPSYLEMLLDDEEQILTQEEIEKYLLSSRKTPSYEFAYWPTHSLEFPSVATQARKFLSIPLTSAEIERLFSGTGKLITPDRCRLSADRASEITFLKENIIKPLYK